MDFGILVPISLFAAIAYAIKAVADASVYRRLITGNTSDELTRTLIAAAESRRKTDSLRWGVILAFLAAGFALIAVMGWDEVTPGVIAILLAATGAGHLTCYAIQKRRA